MENCHPYGCQCQRHSTAAKMMTAVVAMLPVVVSTSTAATMFDSAVGPCSTAAIFTALNAAHVDLFRQYHHPRCFFCRLVSVSLLPLLLAISPPLLMLLLVSSPVKHHLHFCQSVSRMLQPVLTCLLQPVFTRLLQSLSPPPPLQPLKTSPLLLQLCPLSVLPIPPPPSTLSIVSMSTI